MRRGAVVLVALVACGGTPTVLQVVVDGDAGTDDAGRDEDAHVGLDAGTADGREPIVDAAAEETTAPVSCGSDTAATSSSCQVLGPCEDCAGGFRYRCLYGAGIGSGRRPDLAGCSPRSSQTVAAAEWCCVPGCVRYAVQDALCDAAHPKYFACAARDAAAIAPPPAGCQRLDGNGDLETFCCP